MEKKITSALISVFNKEGLEPVLERLSSLGTTIYSTGGTQKFIEQLGISCVPVESVSGFPSILGGRVKTLHPAIFGGILGRSDNETDIEEMKTHNIPYIDLVIVDLYPFEKTVAETTDEKIIIEKIDIGGPSLIRAAAKNYKDVAVIADINDYAFLLKLIAANGSTTLEERKSLAAKAFEVVLNYDLAINNYFNGNILLPLRDKKQMRYGENPHQHADFYGDLTNLFKQLNGKELSYNNLVDVHAAIELMDEFETQDDSACFAIIKHTNVCGVAIRPTVFESWQAALAGDPESAFGGILICNKAIDVKTAEAINELFFEVLIAPAVVNDALDILKSKKNRIILQQSASPVKNKRKQFRSLLNGLLVQDRDNGNYSEWKEVGGRETNAMEKDDLIFANIVCKHLKSNAIAIVKNKQLLGKGCGQTSRIDALRQSIDKARQFKFELNDAVIASDAFFPFDDCVKLGHEAGISAFIQPGGSIRDKDSIAYCKEHQLAMVLTGMRHFKH